MIYTKGLILAEINSIADILKSVELLEERNHYPRRESAFLSEVANKNYLDIWKYCFQNQLYDFQLKDGSLLLFNTQDTAYSFYSCPINCLTYKDYMIECGFDFHETGQEFLEAYEQYLLECRQIEFPLLIRYDYEIKSYIEGLHPVSHLHVGFNSNIRIGIKKILSPIAFTFFLLRQYYPSFWKVFYEKEENKVRIMNAFKKQVMIEERYFNEMDDLEYYLDNLHQGSPHS